MLIEQSISTRLVYRFWAIFKIKIMLASVRIALTVAALKHYKVHQIDVFSASAYERLEELVYVMRSSKFEELGKEKLESN